MSLAEVFDEVDWADTPLGPRRSWSPALQTTFNIVMAAHVAMCAAWGPEQTFFYNEAYAPLLGPRHPSALGQPIAKVWADVWDDIRPLIERAMAGERVMFTDKHLVMSRHGTREDTYWSFSYSPLADGEEIVGFLNITTEATERVLDARRRDAAELVSRRRNEELTRQVVDRTAERDRLWATTYDLMGTASSGGRFVTINPAWTRLLGWTEAELLARPFAAFSHPDDQVAVALTVERVRRGEIVTGFMSRLKTADGGTRSLVWTVNADSDPASDLFHFIGRDISELMSAEEQLRQAQKMEAVGQLTGGLAHDFNNLLAGISGALELMATRISQGRLRDIDRYMVAAQGAAKRAAALTHRLLAFSRRQTLAPRPTNVNALVNGMLEMIQRTVGPGIRVDVVTMAGLWPALVDAPQLENALLNLCINARDAMPGGGGITVETANRWVDRGGSKQLDIPEGQYLSLCVSDTGTGMPPEVVAKAFDPFFTTKPLGQGTGLGLSMIYGFARQSGGQARIYSEMGQGTTVCIYLPRHLGEADADAAGPETALVPQAEVGETVLVVDDEPTVRLLVTDVLDELGYTAIEAADSVAGLKVLQSDVRIDLLVTDVGLPGGMNGRQMADAAKASRPDLRVLFITGFAENALLNNGQLAPGMAVLTKPFALDVLAARLRELIARG